MNEEIRVPDGGRGWIIVVGVAVINIFNQSLLSMFGLIFGATLERLSGTTGVTTIMSINVTISNFSGFLISPLGKVLNTKQIARVGIILVSIGLLTSGYTNSYLRIIFGYGVLTGLGLGLIQSSTFLIINSYFSKNKSQAVGLAMAGTSIGQMGMPPIVAAILENFGYNGTTLILAGLSLNGLVGAMLFNLVHSDLTINKNNKKQEVTSTLIKEDSNCKIEPGGDSKLSETMIKTDENVVEEISIAMNCDDNKEKLFETLEEDTPSCWKQIVNFFNLQMLTDPTFIHIMIGLSSAYTTTIAFSTFFPLFLTEDREMTMFEASSCMSILSFMDLVGRILVPLITKFFNTSHRMIFAIGCLLLAICRSVLAEQTEYSMIMLLSAICGLARAAPVINQNLVIAEYAKEQSVSSALGLNMVSKGVFVLTIGRLLGMYKDSAHNYAGCIHILNIISISVIISWSLEVILKKIIKCLS